MKNSGERDVEDGDDNDDVDDDDDDDFVDHENGQVALYESIAPSVRNNVRDIDLSEYQFPVFDRPQVSDFNYGDALLHIGRVCEPTVNHIDEIDSDDEERSVRIRAQKRTFLAREEFELAGKRFRDLFDDGNGSTVKTRRR